MMTSNQHSLPPSPPPSSLSSAASTASRALLHLSSSESAPRNASTAPARLRRDAHPGPEPEPAHSSATRSHEMCAAATRTSFASRASIAIATAAGTTSSATSAIAAARGSVRRRRRWWSRAAEEEEEEEEEEEKEEEEWSRCCPSSSRSVASLSPSRASRRTSSLSVHAASPRLASLSPPYLSPRIIFSRHATGRPPRVARSRGARRFSCIATRRRRSCISAYRLCTAPVVLRSSRCGNGSTRSSAPTEGSPLCSAITSGG